MSTTANLGYDVFVNDPPPQDGFLPNGEPKRFSPMASTLIYGSEDAVLTDPGMTGRSGACARRLGRRQGPEPHRHLRHPRPRRSLVRRRAAGRTVRGPRRRHRGHDRPDARQRRDAAAAVGQGVPGTDPAVAGHRGDGPGQPLHARGARAGDRRGRPHRQRRHQRPARPGSRAGRRRRRRSTTACTCTSRQSAVVGGFGPWRAAIDKVEALRPRHIVAGHQNKQLDDDAGRTIAETRQYLDDADELLRTENTAVDFFNAKIERYPDHLGRTGPVGRAPARSTASANTPEGTSPRSSSTPGFESPITP